MVQGVFSQGEASQSLAVDEHIGEVLTAGTGQAARSQTATERCRVRSGPSWEQEEARGGMRVGAWPRPTPSPQRTASNSPGDIRVLLWG